MPRPSKPYRREDVDGRPWYARVGGRKVWLAPGTATLTEARKALAAVVAGVATPQPAGAGYTVRDVVNLYLHDLKARRGRDETSARTLDLRRRYCVSARDAIGKLDAATLRPAAVAKWLDSQTTWGASTRRLASSSLVRALRWAADEGHLEAVPKLRLNLAPAGRREKVLAPGDVLRLVAAWPEGDPFRVFLEALRETGCRPGEAAWLDVERVDLAAGTWQVRDKIRRKTGRRWRTVYLSERAAELTRLAIGGRKSGVVFRNSEGGRWQPNAVRSRLMLAAKRLGLDPAACAAYTFRHDFVTRALERGVPPATVAALVGHTSLTQIMRVYSHIRERTDHLREAAERASG